MTRVKQITDPTASAEYKRFQQTVVLFEKYGAKYGFDPLMLAAQGYQESQLKQDAKSHVGAVGVMQLMPATGAELKVGDIKQLEPNIHAGAKYMDQLMTRYFKDAHFDEANRTLFAFAAYNAGPGRIAKMRTEAGKRGLDPDRWFNNVEIGHGREGRDRDDDLRPQHLQVLRRLQAQHGDGPGAREGEAAGEACAVRPGPGQRSIQKYWTARRAVS